MTYREFLLVKASIYWSAGEPVPTDLFYEMLGAGIDVAAEEAKFHSINED